jgi:hypothetical protein
MMLSSEKASQPVTNSRPNEKDTLELVLSVLAEVRDLIDDADFA